ncbi:uncharacterized protein A1O9_11524 [Exophiala aquamarina CBS 119918]|uniref:Uncharacterized protein n=1 Tax=Exophiala aquamarina CBS 119918 TaxID=1182545 RepID=A0A072NWS4_9EURO|nr:uncharacterized protein A1O9_11524 [Exophiala aquamarina CBS 119918]KEF52284.1 hypothetical protein A1O9_11524 [Exophiala aquamarina CBS 119918]
MLRERHRSRSRSPHRPDRRQKHRTRSPHQKTPSVKRPLPLGAHEISRHDLPKYRPMFALYLDIQKQLDIEGLDETESRGRWKSFVSKWNRGELAEGWYDPHTLEKAKSASVSTPEYALSHPVSHKKRKVTASDHSENDDDAGDDYGPALPSSESTLRRSFTDNGPVSGTGVGASIPTLEDLRARDDEARLDSEQAGKSQYASLKQERTLDRKEQKALLDDLAPRAEAGTRERQLEKKREIADSNRAFAAAKDGGGDADLRDSDIMGDENSLGEVKRMKRENERRKNEREIRKEEILRARKAEREVRLAALKEKEDRTMQMFKDIAKARFGGDHDDE